LFVHYLFGPPVHPPHQAAISNNTSIHPTPFSYTCPFSQLTLHTQPNPNQTQRHPNPRIPTNHLPLHIPIPNNRKQKRQRIRNRHRKTQFCHALAISHYPPPPPPPSSPSQRNSPETKLTSLSNQQKEPHAPRQIHHQRQRIPPIPQQIRNPKERAIHRAPDPTPLHRRRLEYRVRWRLMRARRGADEGRCEAPGQSD
jgi:hypothetical protein